MLIRLLFRLLFVVDLDRLIVLFEILIELNVFEAGFSVAIWAEIGVEGTFPFLSWFESGSGRSIGLDFIPLVISPAWLQVEFDRNLAKREMVPEEVQEVPAVLVREALGMVADQDDGWGLRGNLGSVVDFRTLELIQRCFVPFQGDFDQFVEHARRDPLLGLFEEHLCMVQQRFDILASLPGDKGDGAISHCREMFPNVLDPAFGWDLACEFVPFVDHEDAGFEFIVDVVSKLFIDFAHGFGAIEEQQDDIGPANASLGSVGSIPIDIGFDAFAASQARSVDRHEFVAIEFEHHIDAIAGRPGDFADDAAILLGERVDEGAFADVASTDNRHFHRGWFDLFGSGIEIWKSLGNPGQEVPFVAILSSAYSEQITVAQAMEFVGVGVLGLAVGFVGNQQDWFVDFSEPIGDLSIQRDQSAARVDDKDQQVRLFDCGHDLRFDLVGQIVDVFDPDSAGVDQLKVTAFVLDEGSEAIAGHPGKIFNDRQSTAGDPVKNRAFADVRSAYNCNAWDSHRRTMDRKKGIGGDLDGSRLLDRVGAQVPSLDPIGFDKFCAKVLEQAFVHVGEVPSSIEHSQLTLASLELLFEH